MKSGQMDTIGDLKARPWRGSPMHRLNAKVQVVARRDSVFAAVANLAEGAL
jgi:hypothetical protein